MGTYKETRKYYDMMLSGGRWAKSLLCSSFRYRGTGGKREERDRMVGEEAWSAESQKGRCSQEPPPPPRALGYTPVSWRNIQSLDRAWRRTKSWRGPNKAARRGGLKATDASLEEPPAN